MAGIALDRLGLWAIARTAVPIDQRSASWQPDKAMSHSSDRRVPRLSDSPAQRYDEARPVAAVPDPAYLGYQVHPDHAALVNEVIGYGGRLDRAVTPRAADEFGLKRWAAHGCQSDPASVGDTGS